MAIAIIHYGLVLGEHLSRDGDVLGGLVGPRLWIHDFGLFTDLC